MTESDPGAVRDVPAGLTRDCLDPWNSVEFHTDGSVALCCNRPPIGSVATLSLEAILNSPAARQLRSDLLAGRPDELCRKCQVRPVASPEVLRERVEGLPR